MAGSLLLLTGCSGSENIEAAEQQVVVFHREFNSEKFETIYANSDPLFRKSTLRQDFLKFGSALRRKLGKAGKSEQQGWNVNYGTDGTTVSLSYQTEFENGPGAETFIYLVKDGEPRLYGYNVNAAALIMN